MALAAIASLNFPCTKSLTVNWGVTDFTEGASVEFKLVVKEPVMSDLSS